MHASSLDLYRAGTSPWHGLDARVKLSITLAYVLAVSLTPAGAWPAYVLFFTFVLAASVASELGVRFAPQRALLAFPFVLAALPLLATTPGRAFLSIPLGQRSLLLTFAGLERFLSIACRAHLYQPEGQAHRGLHHRQIWIGQVAPGARHQHLQTHHLYHHRPDERN